MRQLFIILLVISASTVQAKNYYISAKGLDTNTGLSPTSAWQTIAKLNASFGIIAAGDSILFKSGETFYGSIVVGKSGTSSLPIVFGSYGTGAQPLISGFTTLSTWTNVGGGIWKTSVNTGNNKLMLVSIDNHLQRMGRYPNYDAANGGYLSYESFNSSAPSITDNQLTATINWTGADAVIRKYSYITSICPITAHSGGTLTYKNTDGNFGVAGYGYFIQNDIRTLDQFGEWFLNKTTKELSVYFGSATPASYTIKASTVDTLFNCGDGGFNGTGRVARSFLVINNIAFEGGNDRAFFSQNGSNMKVQNCTFNNNNVGIYMWNIPNSLTENNTVTNSLNNAILIYGEVSSPSVIRKNIIRNCGNMTGMGGSNDGAYCGIIQTGDNATVEYNRLDSIGFNGIKFNGNNISIRYNHITNFCITKDDGGGIYTYNDLTKINRVVASNIVMRGIGARLGRENDGRTHAIYMDGNTHNVDILNNTVSQSDGSGILLNQGVNIRVSGNTMYNVPWGIDLQRYPNTSTAPSEILHNNIFTKNIFYPTVSNVFYWNGQLNEPTVTTIQANMQEIGIFDSNYVRDDLAAPFDYYYHLTVGGTFVDPPALNFSQWQPFINGEVHSKVIATGANRFEFNSGSSDTTITLDAKYLGVDSTFYNGSITLHPFTSALLLKSGPLDAALKADAGTDISLVLPSNNTILKGSAVGTIISYSWTKIAGPDQFTISSPGSPSTSISNLTVGTYIFQFKVINNTGDSAMATVNVNQTGILPVTLIDFEAQNNNDKIALQWQVASEINVSHYSIERSSDGQYFENIGQLNSYNLADIQVNYNFADNNPLKGINYYRLVMVDRDGTFAYSKVVSASAANVASFKINSVLLSKSTASLTINLNTNYQQNLQIVLADASGRIVYANKVGLQKGFNTIDQKVPAISNGVYFTKLFTDDLSVQKAILCGN